VSGFCLRILGWAALTGQRHGVPVQRYVALCASHTVETDNYPSLQCRCKTTSHINANFPHKMAKITAKYFYIYPQMTLFRKNRENGETL